jgi:hypothetical protein
MNFKNYYKLTIAKIDEEILKDSKISLNKKPLFESPLYHEAEFFNELNDIATNHPFAIERMNDGVFIRNVAANNTSYKLYRNIYDGYFWDFFISGVTGHELLSGFVKYKIDNKTIQVGGVWQIDTTIGLIRALINDYYSINFDALESGTVTNEKGRNFYQKLAKDFIQNNKKVTVLVNNREIPYEINNADSYWKNSAGVPSFDKKVKLYF